MGAPKNACPCCSVHKDMWHGPYCIAVGTVWTAKVADKESIKARMANQQERIKIRRKKVQDWWNENAGKSS